jgi:folate-dependent tRNA-U54 methylase TrmFO/GidA
MTEEEFNAFHEALVNAEVVPLRTFEKEKFFEGCMPIEVMAQRGIKTMLFLNAFGNQQYCIKKLQHCLDVIELQHKGVYLF